MGRMMKQSHARYAWLVVQVHRFSWKPVAEPQIELCAGGGGRLVPTHNTDSLGHANDMDMVNTGICWNTLE